jgi:hypothetical protein
LLQNLDNEQSKKKTPAAADCVSQSHPFFSTGLPLVMALKKIKLQMITNQLNTFLMQYTVLFYVIFSQMYFCSVQNIMYSLFNYHIPFDP